MGDERDDRRCPVCGHGGSGLAFRGGRSTVVALDGASLAPAAAAFGTTVGEVVRCRACGHGYVVGAPDAGDLVHAYAHVADDATLVEEPGQRATAARDLAQVAALLDRPPARLLDVGCWTGSLLSAAAELGWAGAGVEPSGWAAGVAVERGHDVLVGTLDDAPWADGSFQVVACCDVLEHLDDPAAAARRIHDLLEPGGLLFATVPDAGSVAARVLGRRWWSVLPMHVQYFTRASLAALLVGAGFRIEAARTHPKVFTWRYYADRLDELVPVVGAGVARAVRASPLAERPFAPDLQDRLAVVAKRPN